MLHTLSDAVPSLHRAIGADLLPGRWCADQGADTSIDVFHEGLHCGEHGVEDGTADKNQLWLVKKIITKTFELHEYSISVLTVEHLIRGVTSVGKRQGHKTVLPLHEDFHFTTPTPPAICAHTNTNTNLHNLTPQP